MICHEKMTYKNSRGDELRFGENGLYLDEVALGWAFEIASSGNKITSYGRGITDFSLPAMIITDTDEEANAIRDLIHDITYYDIVNQKAGTLVYRDYALECNISEVTNSEYQEHMAFGDVELKVSTDKPFWLKETSHSFVFSDDTAAESGGIDFPFDYPHDYMLIQNAAAFENEAVSDTEFILRIQGVVASPTVYIAGHMYGVDVTLSRGDTLVIDSLNKTITQIYSNGTELKCFNSRKRESNIFQKIPAGSVKVSTGQKLNVELICIDKRGEPRWT